MSETKGTEPTEAAERTRPAWSTRKKDKAPRGVFRHPSGMWAIRYRCGAGCRIHKEKVGPIKHDAIRAYHERRARAHGEPGWCPTTERQTARVRAQEDAASRVSLATYAAGWLDSRKGTLKPRTWDSYGQVLRDHIDPALGGVPLPDLTREMVRGLLTKKVQAGLSRGTVKNILIPLRAMLNDAVDDGKIPANPAARAWRGTRGLTENDAKKVDALTRDELTLVLTTAEKHYPDWVDFLRVLGWTGLRLGEACGLQWGDLDHAGGFVDVRRNIHYRRHGVLVGAPKSGQARRVDVPATLMRRLKDRQEIAAAEAALRGVEPSAWVFAAPTDPVKPVNPAFTRFKVWYKVLTLAGLRSVPLHALRHTYASLLLQAGEPIAYVQRQLGHSSIQVTVDRYGHFIPGENRQAVERLAATTTILTEPAELSRN